MNIKSLTLSIISVAAAVAASQPAVQAQEEHKTPSARWDFAPNVWKKESIARPRGYAEAPAVSVRSGAVPSRNMLGIDPNYLAKAPAPMAAPLVHINHAVSAVPMVAARHNPSPLEAFQHAFGKPISTTPPMVASLPQGLPAQPGQPVAAPTSAGKAVSAHRLPSRSHNASVAGKLLTPQHHVGQSAGSPAALPTIASYGSKFFTPGAFSPTAGSGTSTNAVVNGRIIRR